MEDNPISIKKAAMLNASAKYFTVILQILYMAILSRILSPEEFGIVAVINVFIVFFQLFADMGFGTAVIQNKTLAEDEINQIFTFSIYLGVTLMVLFAGASFIIAAIYNNNIYIPLGFMLSFSLLFNSFNMIPNSVMLKNKRFVAIAMRTVITALISYTITIALAFAGVGIYALATNSIITAFALFIWNEVSIKLKFKRKIHIATLRKVWSYSLYQFGSQAINYFNRNLDNLLIGKYFSTAELGYYNKSYTLAGYPVTYLPGVITPVLHPILSEYQYDKGYIYDSYVKLLKLLSLIGCFGSAFCFFAGREIILIAFGSQWESSIITFRILSLSLWMQILTNTIAPIYQSIGNTKLLFKSTILTTLLIVSFIVIGVGLGSINTIAICVAVAYIINFFVSFAIIIKWGFKNSFVEFLKIFWHEVVYFVVLFVCVLMWPFEIENIILGFAIKFMVYAAIYILLLVLTKQHRILIGFIKNEEIDVWKHRY